jgi:hypothetical protein
MYAASMANIDLKLLHSGDLGHKFDAFESS